MKIERIVKVLIVLAGVGGIMYLFSLNLPRSQAKGVILFCALGLMGLVWGTGVYFDRRRKRELGEALTTAGLIVGEPREARFVHRMEKGQRALEGKFWSHGTDTVGPLEVAEFTYTTGSGKHKQVHRHMQVSRPCPGPWPEFRLSRRRGFLLRPITELGTAPDYGLENEAFGKRWTVECSDRDFVTLLLSPIVQDWLMLAPKHESWTIAEGRVCVTWKRKCDAAETTALIARLDEFLAMVPGELAAYETMRSDSFTPPG